MSAAIPVTAPTFHVMTCLRAETLSIHGPDAIAFAHAQLASDVRRLEPGKWQWSAWLNPQGRVRALLQLICIDEQRLLLLLRGGSAADMAANLRPYMLRSHVTITANEPRRLVDAGPCAAHAWHDDDEGLVLGMDQYALHVTATHGGAQAWRLAAVEAGHPWLPDVLLDELLAPALSLQRLGAVSLDKGCYPGQEIVARMHYRGSGKQHLWQVESDAPLVPGMPLKHADETLGHILDAARDAAGNHRALAILRDSDMALTTFDDRRSRPIEVSKINKL